MSSYYFVGQSVSTQGGTFVTPTFVGPVSFTGQMLGADGTAALPSYSFTNSPSTGMYSPAANQLAFSQNGTQALLFSGSQAATFGGSTVTLTGSATTLVLGQGTADSVGMLRFGDAAANGVRIRKTGAGANVAFESGNNAAYAGVLMGGTKVVTLSGIDSVTNFTVSQMTKTGATKTAATYTVLATDSFTTFNNTGAAAQVAYTLPTGAVGLTYTFVNTGAGATFSKVNAVGSDKIAQAGAIGAAAGSLTATAIWSTVTLEFIGANTWMVVATTGGAWTLA